MGKLNVTIGNPFPTNLAKRSEHAAHVLADFLAHAQEQAILPDSIFHTCKGLVFISMIKVNITLLSFSLSSFTFSKIFFFFLFSFAF